MRPSLVIIEGNISAGKSTLTRDLAGALGFRVFLEPTTTNPYLADFYRDPKQFALKMQIYLLRRRYRVYLAAINHILSTGEGVVLDRSIFSDWVFAEKNRLDGNINSEGFWYYTQLREKMLERLPFPHFTVYLDVKAEVCHQRIHAVRKRAAEVDSGIPLDYLEGLERCYKQFLSEMHSKGSKVLAVDWSSFGSVQQLRQEIVDPKHSGNHGSNHHWDASFLRDVVNSPDVIRSRMIVGGYDDHLDEYDEWSEDDDLIKSNNAELQTLAPSSPVQTEDDMRG